MGRLSTLDVSDDIGILFYADVIGRLSCDAYICAARDIWTDNISPSSKDAARYARHSQHITIHPRCLDMDKIIIAGAFNGTIFECRHRLGQRSSFERSKFTMGRMGRKWSRTRKRKNSIQTRNSGKQRNSKPRHPSNRLVHHQKRTIRITIRRSYIKPIKLR